MKIGIPVASIVTIIFLIMQPFIFISSIQTEDTKKDDSDCDSSYPDVCIPPYPPDLNCDDISKNNFEVLSPDPHGFDREEDGIGCES
jgi:micrococcal nuclease